MVRDRIFPGKIRENPEIPKLLNFRKANHSTENSEMKVKWNGNFQEKNFENLRISHEVVLFFGIYANSQFSTQR